MYIHTYSTLKVYIILNMCLFSSIQNFLINEILRKFLWKYCQNFAIMKLIIGGWGLEKNWGKVENFTKLIIGVMITQYPRVHPKSTFFATEYCETNFPAINTLQVCRMIFPTKRVEVTNTFLLTKLYQYLGSFGEK